MSFELKKLKAYLTPFHCWSSQHKFRRMEMPLKLDYLATILVFFQMTRIKIALCSDKICLIKNCQNCTKYSNFNRKQSWIPNTVPQLNLISSTNSPARNVSNDRSSFDLNQPTKPPPPTIKLIERAAVLQLTDRCRGQPRIAFRWPPRKLNPLLTFRSSSSQVVANLKSTFNHLLFFVGGKISISFIHLTRTRAYREKEGELWVIFSK